MGLRNTFSTTITDLPRNNTVYVENFTIFPEPIANVMLLQDITLRDFIHFIITKPLNVEDNSLQIPDNGTVQFSTTNVIANFLTTEISGTTPCFTGNITRLTIDQLNTVSTNGGHFFNLSNDIGPGFVFLDQATAQGFDSIGSIEGCSFSTENVGWILCDDGITLNDMLFIVMREQAFTVQKGDHIKLTGTLIGATFDSMIASPLTGDALFNIDSGLSITTQILIHDNLFSDAAGGTLFAAGGLDQTDPQVIARNNGNALDSYWVGSLGFKENATPTVVALNTYTDIAGTMVAGVDNERFTISGDTITYIGLEEIKTEIKVSISASRTIPASSGRVIRAAVFIDSGSGFVEQADSFSMSMVGAARNLSFVTKTVILQTNDQIKCQVKNEDTTDSILVIDYNLTVPKL